MKPLVLLLCAVCACAAPQDFDSLAQQAQAVIDTNPAQAAELYRKALALKPDWPEGWFYLGGAEYGQGHYQQAHEAFEKGLPLSPKNGTAWGFLGLCDYELGQYGKAIEEIAKGEELGLGNNAGFETAVRQRAALILIRGSFFDKAMAQLQPLTKHQVNDPAVVEAVGLCALARPDDPAKLVAAQRAVVDLAGQALWAATSQRPEEAKAGYEKLMATYPNEPGVHDAHGLYLMDFDQAAALAEFRKEIAMDPSHWPSLLVAAFLETREGNTDTSLRDAEEALKLAPKAFHWLCYAEIGRSLLAAGKPEKAAAAFEESVKREPGNAQTHFYLEQAYRLSGRRAEAEKEKAEFIRLKAAEDPLSLPGLMRATGQR
jgi:tetratricopeptide (TPR) repeat protein